MRRSIKKTAKRIGIFLLAAILFLVAYYSVIIVVGFVRIPDSKKIVPARNTKVSAPYNTELAVVTYNVGFGAYSDDFSFFMDGGEHSRAFSEEAVVENTNGMIDVITQQNPDFVLLQEVDIRGTRSHFVDQSRMFTKALPSYDNLKAINYDSPYLIYPLKEPIGSNKSCLQSFSRFPVGNAVRRSLPVEPFPKNLVDLDRAYVSFKVYVQGDKSLIMYNLHMSAYTSDGSIATEQIKMLLEDMKTEYEAGNYVIAVGDFNKDLLGDSSAYFERSDEEYNWAQPLDTSLIPDEFAVYAPSNLPSCRSADRPYAGDGSDFVVTVDGMIASSNVQVVSCETIDTGFKYSDHNPVLFKIILLSE